MLKFSFSHASLLLMAVFFFATANPAQAGLLARWELNETSGTTIADSLGNYDLTNGGAGVSLGSGDVPAGMPGTSVGFVHPNSLLSRPFTGALNPATFTATFWAKPSSISPVTNQEFLVGSINGGTDTDGWAVRWQNFNGGNAEWGVQVGTTAGGGPWLSVQSGSSYAANEWYHVAFQVTEGGASDTARLYINGVLEDTETGFDFDLEDNAVFAIGGRTDYTDFNGLIDDVQLYDMELSASEIAFLANNPGAAIVPVPEPATYTIIALGLAWLAMRRRQRTSGVSR